MSVLFSVKVSFLSQKNRANYNFLRFERFKKLSLEMCEH